jgi:hypothetical protein
MRLVSLFILLILAGNEIHSTPSDLTEAEVRKDLNLDEECRLASGGVMLHGTSACSFVMMGLDIEDTQ